METIVHGQVDEQEEEEGEEEEQQMRKRQCLIDLRHASSLYSENGESTTHDAASDPGSKDGDDHHDVKTSTTTTTTTTTTNAPSSSNRQYQNELFEMCKDGNFIAVAPTGSGKTKVALMLIEHALDRDPSRKVIFVVHKIPLVVQQRLTLQNQLKRPYGGSRVGSFHSYRPFCQWSKAMNEYDVIVCTAQVLLNALEKPDASLSSVQLLIFDECHHAKLNHPYRTLIKQFYLPLKRQYLKQQMKKQQDVHVSEDNGGKGVIVVGSGIDGDSDDNYENARHESDELEMYRHIPRILGLSASPAANMSTAETLLGILQLCYDLDCKIRTVEKHVNEMSEYVNIPDVQQFKVDMDSSSIRLRTVLIGAIHRIRQRIYRELLRDNENDDHGGSGDVDGDSSSVGSDHVFVDDASLSINADQEPSQDSITELIQMTESSDESSMMEQQAGEGRLIIEPNQAVQTSAPLTIRDRLSILGRLINLFNDCLIINDDRSSFASWQLLSNQIARTNETNNTFLAQAFTDCGLSEQSFDLNACPVHCQKRHKLLELLQQRRQEQSFKVLIFVKTRISAIELKALINETCNEFLTAEVLLGHGAASTIAGMTPARQKEVLNQFYIGEINVLIATSVAEEGIDIPSCKLVIRMDGIESTLQLIQSRGRARSHNSEFYCIAHNQSRTGHHIEKYIIQEKKMSRAISILTRAERFTHDLYKHDLHLHDKNDDLTMTVSHMWEVLWFCRHHEKLDDPYERSIVQQLEPYPDKIATTLLHSIEKLLGVKTDVGVEQDTSRTEQQYLGYVSIKILNDRPKLTEPYQAANRLVIYADDVAKRIQDAKNGAVKKAFDLFLERDLIVYPSFNDHHSKQKQQQQQQQQNGRLGNGEMGGSSSSSNGTSGEQQQQHVKRKKKKKAPSTFLQISTDNLADVVNMDNSISILQNYCNRKGNSSPVYHAISTDQRQFVCTCTISEDNFTVKTEAFSRKKESKKMAALLMCQQLVRHHGTIEVASSTFQA